MSYFLVNNFNLGIDRRRPIYAALNGSVWDAVNCHLTRGGDLEKRKAFISKFTLPAGQTFGLLASGGLLYTFGSVAGAAVPPGITYLRLQHPDGIAISKLLWATSYDGVPYAVAQFADNAVYHFYNGVIVGTFVDGIVRASFATLNGIAAHLRALIVADTAYTTGVAGAVITITAVNNNAPFTITKTVVNKGSLNDQNITIATTQVATVSLPQISTATISGTPEVGDRFCITLAGKEYGAGSIQPFTPSIVYTFRSKVYGLAQSLLEFSGTSNAGSWNTLTAGAGFLNLATADAGSAVLTGVEVYQGNLVIFSNRIVQVYFVREDAAQNALLQTLKNTGTTSPKSVLAYGDIDVFYLSDSGIRSIRARAPSNAAFVNDIGTTIDDYIRPYRNTLTQAQIDAAVAVIEPLDGRYMLALGNKIYVLSYFPGSEISGWTSYDVPFQITDFATVADKLYARAGEAVYLYGGDNNSTYDASKVTIQLPFLDGGKDGTGKQVKGIDISSTGEWYCEVLINPRNLTDKIVIGGIDGVTWGKLDASAYGYGTHIAPNFICQSSSYASMSVIGISYEAGNEQG